ncbi:MAG TPA: hypothetical protein PKE12_15090 [Kiritimatiellia bacterium]|nr:hypothetical protein [Kiritimatiellia bacterium]
MRAFSLITVVCAALGSTLLARGQALELGVRYWEMKPGGTVSVGSGGTAGTTVDIKDDLGYRSTEQIFGFDAALGYAGEFHVSYFAIDASARNTIEMPITYDDITFAADANVRSSLDADFLRLAYRHPLGVEPVSGGLLAGVQWVDMKSEVEADGFGWAKAKANAVLPVVGVQLRVEPTPILRLELGLTGGTWDWSSTRVTFWDGEASLRLLVYPFFAGFGYRHVAVEGRENGVPLDIDLNFRGPQFIGGFVF